MYFPPPPPPPPKIGRKALTISAPTFAPDTIGVGEIYVMCNRAPMTGLAWGGGGWGYGLWKYSRTGARAHSSAPAQREPYT